MSETCTVVIAAADVLATLKERAAAVNGEVLTFSDAEAIRALDVIIKRRPSVVTIERVFASTPRGAALINRIKADPDLVDSEIHVVAHDTDYARVLSRQGGSATPRPAPVAAAPAPAAVIAPTRAAVTLPPLRAPRAIVPAPAAPPTQGKAASVAPSQDTAPAAAPADQRGTRRAARFRLDPPLEILVDGNGATLLDLSVQGAQVVSPAALKPNQRVRIVLSDDQSSVRLTASVAWASFEITKSGPRYRAGVEFVRPDERAVEAFCERHSRS